MDTENAGPSRPIAFVPVIGGHEQWIHYDLASHYYAESNHVSKSVFYVCFVIGFFPSKCLFCTTQEHSVQSRRYAPKWPTPAVCYSEAERKEEAKKGERLHLQ